VLRWLALGAGLGVAGAWLVLAVLVAQR
jgi:hypothetical protein